jgi:hypothetical protein
MMNKIYFPVVLFLLFKSVGFSQPAIQWQKSYGGTNADYSSSISQTMDGGYIVGNGTFSTDGDVTGNHGLRDFLVVKIDSLGNIEWEKSLGGTDGESGNVIQTPDGGYLCAGYSYSNDGDINDHHGPISTSDIWIVKLDSASNIVWKHSYGGSGYETLNAIHLCSDGNYLVTGYSNSFDGDVTGCHAGPDSLLDVWIFKLDSQGNLLWQKCFGGTGTDYGEDIRETNDGGYVLCNLIFGTNDGDVVANSDTGANALSIWIVKLDSSLNIQWQKIFGGTDWDDAWKIYQTNDNGFLIGGYTQSSDGDISYNHGYRDIWLIQTDSLGAIRRQKCFGGIYSDTFSDLEIAPDGTYYIVGMSDTISGDITNGYGLGDYWILHVDTSFNILWQHNYGGSGVDWASDICITSDGGLAVTGSSESNDYDVSGHHGMVSTDDIWILKLLPYTTGINESERSLNSWTVYPNPFTETLNVNFALDQSEEISFELKDIEGRTIMSLPSKRYSEGNSEFSAKLPSLTGGIYFAMLKCNDFTSVIKVIH